jgi:hypothetical protein
MSKPSFGLNIVNHALIRKVRSEHRLPSNDDAKRRTAEHRPRMLTDAAASAAASSTTAWISG